MADIPEAEIEPRAPIWRTERLEPEQILDRPFKTDRRRMSCCHARIGPSFRFEADDGDIILGAEECQVHMGRIAPHGEQCAAARSKLFDSLPPTILNDSGARPRPVCSNRRGVRYAGKQSHG